MKALVHDGNGNISLQERPRPTLQLPTDAIVRVTRSTICTSDLHIMRGAVPRALPDTVLGHEFAAWWRKLARTSPVSRPAIAWQ